MAVAKADSLQPGDEPVYEVSGEHRVMRVAPDQAALASRQLANEVPVALEFNGEPYAVMMLTPSDLEDFAVGFALSERIIVRANEIARIDIREGTRGIGVDVRLEKENSARLAERRRSLPGQSGCGICGLTSIEEALPQLAKVSAPPHVSTAALFAALQALPARQTLNTATGAVHAASFCKANGEIMVVREDVGRHNAFDKITGHLARTGIDPSGGFALLTSRCSYELVQKAVLAGIPMLVTISAPTELAVSIAKATDLTLVALARGDSVLVFNDPHFVFPKIM
jgi:FdhD protein